MIFTLYFLSILVSGTVESLFFQIPLTLLILIFACIHQKKEWIFFLAIFAGIMLDSLTFRLLGLRSLFFLITVGVLFVYRKKFETNNIFFGIFFSFLASIFYLLFFGSESYFFVLLLTIISSGILFSLPSVFMIGKLGKISGSLI